MIDEKKLIDRLKHSTFLGRHSGGEIEEYINFNKVKEIIREQSKVSEWIPCSERFPEVGEEVLVTYLGISSKKPHCSGIAFIDESGRWYWSENGISKVMVEIIAWMPLPEPYIRGEI